MKDLPSAPAYPVHFNSWKHHAAALRERIALVVRGQTTLDELCRGLAVIGSELMDLYTGVLSPVEIGDRVIAALEQGNHLSPEAYRLWLEANGGYQVLDFSEDSSRWILRLGEPQGRYVHVHPGRWTPHTIRVRANVLKTAVMVVAVARAQGKDPLELALINQVRTDYLGYSPIKNLRGAGGIRGTIEVLRGAAACCEQGEQD
jgi:hypothetical protein